MASVPSVVIVIWQLSKPSEWQSGMRSSVRLAAIVPAMMAVWKTGPLRVWISAPVRCCIMSGPSATTLRARAVRRVTAFPPTSTIAGLPSESRCEKLLMAL